MDKAQKEIMVVDRSTLFADGYFQGFSPAEVIDYYRIIQDNYFYEKRSVAETKPEFKQPIAYCLIMNKQTKHIFSYQRSAKEGHYDEKRLRGKWSWGIGGHIDRIDLEGKDPILTSMLRELEEEVFIESYDPPEILGYINDDTTEVGEVHFGILFLLRTSSTKVKPVDEEIAWGDFMPLAELEEICMNEEKSVESWSEISLDPLKRLLRPRR